jgi:hypothetical protein
MARYVQRQAEAHAAGLAALEVMGEVEPYEAGPVQPIDARPAWDEALAAVRHLAVKQDRTWKAPPGWPQLVAAHEPAYSLALALGNFPQLVRNLHPLLQTANLAELRPSAAARAAHAPGLAEWAEKVAGQKKFPDVLLALGTLRLAHLYEQAERLMAACEADVPAEWQALWDNEKAALAWHRGDLQAALTLWQAMPDSVPVLFNRGMAALFLDQPAAARETLNRVVAELPETSAWHHLARLYLTLAESRA